MTEILVPDSKIVNALHAAAAPEEHPNANPFAVYEESVLSAAQCEQIVKDCSALPRDALMEHCGAEVRPVPTNSLPFSKEILSKFWSHGDWWDFDIDQMTFAFMTYRAGCGYDWHVDIAPGVSRKLSASVQLSDPTDYIYGDLIIRTIEDYTMPRTQGTIVTFPAYMLHSVTPLYNGIRHSLVIATWGEPFR